MPPSPPARPRMPSISRVARASIRRSASAVRGASASSRRAISSSEPHTARGTGRARGVVIALLRGHMLRKISPRGDDPARRGVRNRVNSNGRRPFLLALCAVMYFSGRYQHRVRFRGGGRRDHRRSASSHERPRPHQARSNLMPVRVDGHVPIRLCARTHHGRSGQRTDPRSDAGPVQPRRADRRAFGPVSGATRPGLLQERSRST